MRIVTFLFISLSAINTFSQSNEAPENIGKIQAEVFGDYFYKVKGAISEDSLYSGGEYQRYQKNNHGMAFRRFNLGYEHLFNNKFDARIMLEGNDAFTSGNDTRSVYIKYAYLGWNFSSMHRLIIGAQPTPTFSTFSERHWGYRSIEKTITDFRREASSNDVGIALTGKFNKEGSLGYFVMLGNGSSTKIETNNFKRLYTSIHGLTSSKIAWQLYADYEGADDNINRYLFKVFMAYTGDRLTAGVEPYYRLTNQNGEVKKSTFGTAAFIRGQISDNLKAFSRIDFYDPDIKNEDFYKETFIVFGLDYNPFKGVSIMPNIWINGYNPEGEPVPGRDADIVARLTFWFKI